MSLQKSAYAILFAFIIAMSSQPDALFAEEATKMNTASEAEHIVLWPDQAPTGDGKFEKSDASIAVYHPANPNGTAMIICPGGGYATQVMGAEGTGIAKWLGEHGITGVVLKYRLPKHRAYVPLLDVQQAIRLTRGHAQEWKLNAQRIGVIGFSAGGHLASSAGVHYAFAPGDTAGKGDKRKGLDARPDFMILIYPVIGMGGKLNHQGSRNNLLGPDASDELAGFFSNQDQVTSETPPAFMAHAVDDKVVSSEHSKAFADALQAKGVKAKYLELPNGGHGLSGYKGPSWEAWKSGSLEWLSELGFLPTAPAPKP